MSKVKLIFFLIFLALGILVISGTFIFSNLVIISGSEIANHILGISLGLLLIAIGGLILGS